MPRAIASSTTFRTRAAITLALVGSLGITAAMATMRLARFASAIGEARRRARRARRYERRVADARRSVLVTGDSLAFGFGPDGPERSIAGLIAAEFPDADVHTVASVGARTHDVATQISSEDGVHDVILIVVGANDVMRLTRIGRIADALRDALRVAATRTQSVVVCTSANVGGAPIFFWPLNRLLDRRSTALRDRFRDVCRDEGASFVSFCFDRRRDVFGLYPQVFYAPDGLHPTAAAYRVCYQLLKAQASLDARLGARGTRRVALHT